MSFKVTCVRCAPGSQTRAGAEEEADGGGVRGETDATKATPSLLLYSHVINVFVYPLFSNFYCMFKIFHWERNKKLKEYKRDRGWGLGLLYLFIQRALREVFAIYKLSCGWARGQNSMLVYHLHFHCRLCIFQICKSV